MNYITTIIDYSKLVPAKKYGRRTPRLSRGPLSKRALSMQMRRDAAREKGFCAQCAAKPVVPGYSECATCRIRRGFK
jgi:hypothetical protein